MIRDLRELLSAAWRLHPKRMVAQIVLMAVGAVLGGFSLLLLIPIINVATGSDGIVDLPGIGSVDLSSVPLPLILGAFVAFAAIQGVISLVNSLNSVRIQTHLVDHLREQAFEAVIGARWEYVIRRRQSDVVSIATNGAGRAAGVVQQMSGVWLSVVMFVVSAVLAFVLEPAVAAVAALLVLFAAGIQATNIIPSRRLGTAMGGFHRMMQGNITDSLESLRLIKAHDASGTWLDLIKGSFSDVREVQFEQARRSGLTALLSSVGLAAAAALLVYVGISVGVEAGVLVVLLILVNRMAGGAKSLVAAATGLAMNMPAVNELFTVFREARSAAEVDPDVQIEDGPDPAAGPVMLEFKDVTYTYPGGDDGVHDLSFRAHTGEVTALAGRSGSGKSTSADLALGLLRPAEGQVLVGGRELTPARFAWWRRHVAYVPQDVLIVPGTLRHNLTWSVPREVSDEECFEVLRDAACDFAVDLADGLDTKLGDHGLRLSGGERQRVAIARALLRRPRFLVLDEATSALDDEREADVMDVITGLQPDVTVLMIAHRKTTLARADHVVHIVKGRRAVDLTKTSGSATPAALVDDAIV